MSRKKSLRKSLKKLLKKSLRKSRRKSPCDKKSLRNTDCLYGVNQYGCCNKKPSVQKTQRCLEASKRRCSPCKYGEDENGCCNKKPTQHYITKCKQLKRSRKNRQSEIGNLIDNKTLIKYIKKSIRKSRKPNLLKNNMKKLRHYTFHLDSNSDPNKPVSNNPVPNNPVSNKSSYSSKLKKIVSKSIEVAKKIKDAMLKLVQFTTEIGKLIPTLNELNQQINELDNNEFKEIMKKINNFIIKCQNTASEIQKKPDITIIQNKFTNLINEATSIHNEILTLKEKIKGDEQYKKINANIDIIINFFSNLQVFNNEKDKVKP